MVKYSYRTILNRGVELLEQREYNNPQLDVQLILMHILDIDKVNLLTNPDKLVIDEDCERFFEMVELRNTGYPLQYMLNKQEFMGLDFYVQEGVLVPRPDTETLIEVVEKLVKETNQNGDNVSKSVKILDIGTGSGAIAVSLGYFIKNSVVTAVDISEIAIETAKINAKKFDLKNVDVIYGDLFGNLNLQKDEKFDVIVSNPPYIVSEVIRSLQTEVSKYEPKLALDGGESGLIYYEKIAEVGRELLSDNGILCVEIGNDQGVSVPGIFEKTELFKNVEVIKDLSGNDRVVVAKSKHAT